MFKPFKRKELVARINTHLRIKACSLLVPFFCCFLVPKCKFLWLSLQAISANHLCKPNVPHASGSTSKFCLVDKSVLGSFESFVRQVSCLNPCSPFHHPFTVCSILLYLRNFWLVITVETLLYAEHSAAEV